MASIAQSHTFGRRQSHIGCICLAFLHCAFSNVFSKRLHKKMQSHIGCICLNFLHFAFSNMSSNPHSNQDHNFLNFPLRVVLGPNCTSNWEKFWLIFGLQKSLLFTFPCHTFTFWVYTFSNRYQKLHLYSEFKEHDNSSHAVLLLKEGHQEVLLTLQHQLSGFVCELPCKWPALIPLHRPLVCTDQVCSSDLSPQLSCTRLIYSSTQLNEVKEPMMQSYKGTKVQRYKDAKIQSYKDTKIQSYKGTKIKTRKDTKMPMKAV